MTIQIHKILSRLSSRASVRRTLLLLAVLMIGVNAWGWRGSDPFNYYYLKNLKASAYYGESKYLYSLPSAQDDQWFAITNSSTTATSFVISDRMDEAEKKMAFIFTKDDNTYWLGKDKNWFGTKHYAVKKTTEYEWVIKTSSGESGFQICDGGRHLNEKDNTKISIPSETDKDEWVFWDTIPKSTNNDTTEYYLYNVGTSQFLVFQRDGTGQVKTFMTSTPSFASLITINKTSRSTFKLKGENYYLFHSNGINEQYTSNDFYFNIYPKTIDGKKGYQLKSGNRYAYAKYGNDGPKVSFPTESNINPNTDKNSLWLFIAQREYDAAIDKKLPGIPHVLVDYDKDMFYDGKITTRLDEGKWDDGENRIWLTAEKDTFDIHFEGIPEMLSFGYRPKTAKGSPGIPPYEDRIFSVMQSSDGKTWSEPIFYKINNSTDTLGLSGNISLEPTTHYLRFCISGCTAAASVEENIGGLFYNINVTELHQFDVEPTSINFGKHGKDDGVFDEYILFSHANAGKDVNVSVENVPSSDLTSYYLVSPVKIPNTGQDEMRTEYVKVSYIASSVGTHNAIITISDNKSHSKTISVTGNRVEKHVPIFTWNPRDAAYYFGNSIDNVFSTTNRDVEPAFQFDSNHRNGSVSIEKGEDGCYKLVIGDTVFHQVTVTVTQEGDDDYWDSNSKDYSFTPREKPSLVVPFKFVKANFEEALSSNHYLVPIKNEQPRLKWVDAEASKENNDLTWYNEDGEFMRLGFSSTGSSDAFLDWSDKYIYFEFAGQPDSLFFKYTTYPLATGPDWYVFESASGEGNPMTWSRAWHVSTNTSNNFQSEYKQAAIALKPSTRFICLCYSGNYCGRFQDIRVTAYDGLYYLRNKDGKYLSRGGDDGTKAVVDDYGIAVRKTRSTDDNVAEHTYTRFQYVDQFAQNKKFLGLFDGRIYTNTLSNINFLEEKVGVTDSIRLKINDVAPVGLDYSWFLEEVTDHPGRMQQLKDNQAIAAATEFNVDVPTMAILKQKLLDNDYQRDTINLFDNNVTTIQQLEQAINTTPVAFELQVDTGMYCLSLKAFSRSAGNDDAYTAYLKGYDNPVAYVFARDSRGEKRTQLCSVYDFLSTEVTAGENYNPRYKAYYPANTDAAEAMFATNVRYENDVFIYVHEDVGTPGKGTLHYGFVSPSNGECNNWVCWKSFTLTKFSRKDYIFIGGASGNNWGDPANWLKANDKWANLPLLVHKVILANDVVVNISDAQAYTIVTNGHSITIAPSGGLTVGEGGITGVTSCNDLSIQSDKDRSGFLRVSPKVSHENMPLAKVQMYSKAYYDKSTSANAAWQYVGTPVENDENAQSIQTLFYRDWLYRWDGANGWINAKNEQTKPLHPFHGYSLTQKESASGKTYEHQGRLISRNLEDTTLSYSAKGHVIANSYAAPIDIRNFYMYDAFGNNLQQTIYIFNTGSKTNIQDPVLAANDRAEGQYTAIPIAAEIDKIDNEGYSPYIAPMQAFVIKHKGQYDTGNTFSLRYKELVWDSKYDKNPNEPMKAPGRFKEQAQSSNVLGLYLQVYSAKLLDKLYMLESTEYTHAFDNGYDAEKMSGTVALSLYAIEDSLHMAVDATPQLNGTYIGFHSEADSVYHFRFKYVETEEPLYLLDLQTGKAVPMIVDTVWTFYAEPDSAYQLRFRIVDESMLPAGWDRTDDHTATEISNTTANVELWQAGEFVYASSLGAHTYRLYDAQGRLVAEKPFIGSYVYDLSGLALGVYVATVEDTMIKVVVK